MSGIRRKVVGAWVDEQVSINAVTVEEAFGVTRCLDEGNGLECLVELVKKTGDTTPLEILAGPGLRDRNINSR